MKLDINPQEVMMLAEEYIRNNWIQGTYMRGDSVCLVGALRKAAGTVVGQQLTMALMELPEFASASPKIQQMYVNRMKTDLQHRLAEVFQQRMLKHVPTGGAIESYNDTNGRQHEEVMNVMRATLEEVTQECIERWDAESASPSASPTLEAAVGVRRS